MFSMLIHFAADSRISFFLCLSYNPLYVYTLHFLYALVTPRDIYFYIKGIMNNALALHITDWGTLKTAVTNTHCFYEIPFVQ